MGIFKRNPSLLLTIFFFCVKIPKPLITKETDETFSPAYRWACHVVAKAKSKQKSHTRGILRRAKSPPIKSGNKD